MAATSTCYNSFLMGNTAEGYPGAGLGGALRMIGDNSLIRNCLVVHNRSSSSGGGIKGDWSLKIQNCTIASNVAIGNGGGYAYQQNGGSPAIENTIIWGNSGSGIYSNLYIIVGTNTFTNCCTSPDIVSAFATAVNTITNDPLFINTATNDFRLQPDSPCINAGVNREWMEGAQDYYGNRRIDNFRKTVDIGAYEYLSHGTLFRGH
ncbi:MAG: right-handed parallel beta-helix repeat-containing protein [Kiritimatiellaeota bacterium]|nr:right-handed parallel beta-helix repeat-containing protein [Kiritimatiellota bacterium]